MRWLLLPAPLVERSAARPAGAAVANLDVADTIQRDAERLAPDVTPAEIRSQLD